MAEYHHKENVIESTAVMTGDINKRTQLYYQLIKSIKKARSVDIIVSFLMESGVRMLLDDLEKALERGASIRILTGNYLGITQPSALYLVKEKLGERVDLRFYDDSKRSFHPKSYFFHYDDHDELYIGSSNVSKSALTSGIEWNYRLNSIQDQKSYDQFYATFEDLFQNHSIIIDDGELKRYSQNWHQPLVARDLERYEKDTQVYNVFEPRGAQIEALCALENTRAEGAKRALVSAATGVGKTYLAAFDSKSYQRVLFVAHRQEILHQAAVSFRNVRQNSDYGFFNDEEKCIDKPVIFASVSTLGKKKYLNDQYFSPDYFDYIVIDEFHHAVNDQYRRIVNYFKPEFLLGLTATPERMDGRNIYELCDYNVPFEISLKDAINKGLLSPFHYYGIYDDMDYSNLTFKRGHYDEKELTEAYLNNEKRYDLIYRYYRKYGSDKALGFCVSRLHAEAMAREFSKRHIPSAAVYSNATGEYSMDREAAIKKLKSGDIHVIFSVDMFNEGVDIPDVDMVMFLRPTESPTVFYQQLGRGLRKSPGKEYLTVLDFIGNYEKAGRIRFLLSNNASPVSRLTYHPIDATAYPDGCLVDFDMKLIDLFEKIDHNNRKLKDKINDEYYKIKDLLNHRPSRAELFTYMDDEIYQLALNHSKDNPFKQYLSYLDHLGELDAHEKKVFNSIAGDFIHILETTNMSKVYKMPVLQAFYNDGDIRMAVTEEQLLESWKAFFSTSTNWKDLDKNMTYEKYQNISDKNHISKIMKMPVHFLQSAANKGFFVQKEGYALALKDDIKAYIHDDFFKDQMKDVIEYRTLDYYQRRYHDQVKNN